MCVLIFGRVRKVA